MFQKVLTYIAIILISTITVVSIGGIKEENTQGNEAIAAAKIDNENPQLTDEIVNEKIKLFKQNLIQATDENGKVKAYKTKSAFLQSFDGIARKEALPQFTDVLYEEREDGLYLSSIDTPPWFNPNNDYDMIELDKDKFVVKQENTSALNGTYNISFRFFYENGWKIQDVEYE